jgi:DNA-binding CsgD family transcriptional regulator
MPSDEDVHGILRAVRALVRCDTVFWNRTQVSPRRLVAEIANPTPADVPDCSYEEWAEHVSEHPIMSGTYGPVVAVSDVYSASEFRRTWLYHHFFRGRVKHEIGVHLSHPPGELHVVFLCRAGGPDFDARDRRVLELLRPHLDAALQRRVLPPVELTPRETEVLRCVRDGLSNAQVARQLGITEATVEKHLEHVYARTGARSRVQALNLCSGALS